MDKKFWHHIWAKHIRPIKIWYLVVLTLASGLVCVVALRNNNATMGRLREEVYSADQQNGDVVGALQKLQQYVTTHMNTSLTSGDTSVYPPVQLKYTYERLQTAAQQKAAAANSKLYSDAQFFCERQNATDFSGRNRVPCIEQYVSDRGGATAEPIPDSMYKFNFATPQWSPDLAGISLALALAFAILTVLRFVLGWIFPRLTK